MNKDKVTPIGAEWSEARKELYTPEEIAASDLRVNIICEFIKARNELNMTQKDLETATGIKQPMLARIESGATDPQLSTLLKVLAPLGKTLAVVPLK